MFKNNWLDNAEFRNGWLSEDPFYWISPWFAFLDSLRTVYLCILIMQFEISNHGASFSWLTGSQYWIIKVLLTVGHLVNCPGLYETVTGAASRDRDGFPMGYFHLICNEIRASIFGLCCSIRQKLLFSRLLDFI